MEESISYKNMKNTFKIQHNEYYTKNQKIDHFNGSVEKLTDQILTSCGIGSTLNIGSGEGSLVAELLRRGVNAHGFDTSEVMTSRCNQRIPNRFTQGSVLKLPFKENSFQTIVSTDCMQHLTPEEVSVALKEIHRVSGRYFFLKITTTSDREKRWDLTIEGRYWWETKCLEAGFRKHPAYYKIIPYESLNHDDPQIIIPLEKIPAAALLQYPLVALKEDWHSVACAAGEQT